MKLPSLKRTKTEEAPAPKVHPKPAVLTEGMVWEAPANYNRATRRWARLVGRIWKWDREQVGPPADLPPRFVRRHFDSAKFLFPKTRRQRWVRARVLRAMKAKGMTV